MDTFVAVQLGMRPRIPVFRLMIPWIRRTFRPIVPSPQGRGRRVEESILNPRRRKQSPSTSYVCVVGTRRMTKLLRVVRRPWNLVPILILGCWITSFFGPVSMLILPALIMGAVVTVARKAWLAFGCLLALNPLGFHFAGGVVDYFRGAPSLWFTGLPRIESFNLDRTSRCFRAGGGCLVFGNEWVSLCPHNAALRLTALVFGPPTKSYDGPYPTEEEAKALTTGATATPLRVLQEGNVTVDGQTIFLGIELITQIVEGLQLSSLRPPDRSLCNSPVQATLHQERCLLLRLSEEDTFSSGSADRAKDILVFLDMKTKRPFAYFRIKGSIFPRFPPAGYLPERDLS